MWGWARANRCVRCVLDDVGPNGYCGGVIRVVGSVRCSSFGIGSSFGDHVNYFLQLFSAVFLEVVRLVVEEVW